jgi:hypothetical protein
VLGRERGILTGMLLQERTHCSVSVSCVFLFIWIRKDFHQFDMPPWHILEKAASIAPGRNELANARCIGWIMRHSVNAMLFLQ